MLAILIIITLAILCYYYMGQSKSSQNAQFIVYGTTWCGYTTKQREHLDKKYGKGSHIFIDCDKENCPGITAFPVTEKSNGIRVKGFNQNL